MDLKTTRQRAAEIAAASDQDSHVLHDDLMAEVLREVIATSGQRHLVDLAQIVLDATPEGRWYA